MKGERPRFSDQIQMADAPTKKYILDPEPFVGHIEVDDYRIPVSLTASADDSGALSLDLAPIPMASLGDGAFVALLSNGGMGQSIHELGLQCASESGKVLDIDRAFLSGHNSKREAGLVASMQVVHATLTIPLESTEPAPSLSFRLKGFECFPQVRGECGLGRLSVGGATRRGDLDVLTGDVNISATIVPADLLDWKAKARKLLLHIRSTLSFARSGHVALPVIEFRHGSKCEVEFYQAGPSSRAELSPISHLNYQPIVSAAIENFDSVEEIRDAFETTIGWLLVPSTHDEVRFLTAMTALESLATSMLGKEFEHIAPTPSFKKLASAVREAIDTFSALDSAKLAAIKAKVPELNRPSFFSRITTLLELWQISRELISDDALKSLVALRNKIVHEGAPPEDHDVWEAILLIREVMTRLVFAMLHFEGHYDCFVGGHRMRSFPDCQPISASK